MKKEKFHWADSIVDKVIKIRGNKSKYVCAAGVGVSGTIHIGNFRDIATTLFVVKMLGKKGKKIRFIYSWDDYDRFRKVPANIPKSWDKYLGMAVSDVPDPWKCHKSYAEHFEEIYKKELSILNLDIEFISQSEKYKKCVYAEEIKKALVNREKIIKILDKYRKEPLSKDWIPLLVYCERCKKDSTRILDYDEKYAIKYECNCGFSNKIDFRKKGIVKLPWRVDWPMRWAYEKVDFEPGGKDLSTKGGSVDTGKQIIKEIWKKEVPLHTFYSNISIKGQGGKISGSKGNVITLTDILEIYEPEVILWLFAGTKPYSEFAISFDLDVIKMYEDFDRLEKKYYDKKADGKERKIYELCLDVKKSIPKRVGFRHLTMLVQIYEGRLSKFKGEVRKRAECAWNWISKYAPEEMKFKIQDKIPSKVKRSLSEKQITALKELIKILKKTTYNQKTLFDEFYKICKKVDIKNTDFFKGAYLALIGKEKGPKLAPFILVLGKERIVKILNQL